MSLEYVYLVGHKFPSSTRILHICDNEKSAKREFYKLRETLIAIYSDNIGRLKQEGHAEDSRLIQIERSKLENLKLCTPDNNNVGPGAIPFVRKMWITK